MNLLFLYDTAGLPEGYGTTSIILYIINVVIMWKAYEKAGHPGWGAIIPIYNVYILVKMADYRGISMLLLLVPIVNIIYLFLIYFRISENFGHGLGFCIGLILLSPIFWGILAFGDSTFSSTH